MKKVQLHPIDEIINSVGAGEDITLGTESNINPGRVVEYNPICTNRAQSLKLQGKMEISNNLFVDLEILGLRRTSSIRLGK